MSDEPVKVCERCGEPVKRLLFPVAIQFKGNGFYTTDYARRSGLGSVGSQTGGGDSESSTTESSTTESSKTESSKTATSASTDSASKSD
jgi:predicted nucleic acid-binding Zn ribbon protein